MLKPRLTVSIITRNSEKRLAAVVESVGGFADEIIIGVDAGSDDRTLDVATAVADIVYQFRHTGWMAQARMLPFKYATGDWILALDDDEMVEDAFDEIVPELLSNRFVTHYVFPRKHIVSFDPCQYLHATPWFPDWQGRLFRNDSSLVWKPDRAHTGYHVLGPSYFETRASLLHFEPVWCGIEDRQRKLESYRRAGSDAQSEGIYVVPADLTLRRSVQLRRPLTPRRKTSPAIIHCGIHEVRALEFPPLRSSVVRVDVPDEVCASEQILAQVVVKNIGDLPWMPPNIRHVPLLCLGCHLLDANGKVIKDFVRSPVPRFVGPGDEVKFVFQFNAPDKEGVYWLEWDMVSEFEFWFAQGESEAFRSRLNVWPQASG